MKGMCVNFLSSTRHGSSYLHLTQHEATPSNFDAVCLEDYFNSASIDIYGSRYICFFKQATFLIPLSYVECVEVYIFCEDLQVLLQLQARERERETALVMFLFTKPDTDIFASPIHVCFGKQEKARGKANV